MGYRILALDIDGTILDPYGQLTESVGDAIGAARRRGLWVVLCTGRRFRTALPFARELGLEGAIVVHNGAVVKDIDSGQTLSHSYLPTDAYAEVIAHVRRRSSPLVYVDTFHEDNDIFAERCTEPHPYQREYLDDNSSFFQRVDDLLDHVREDVIMVSTMADEGTLASLRIEAEDAFGTRVRTHTLINKNYQGGILEFLSPGSGKWESLARVAADAGIGPDQIIAVGDDTNDIGMLQGAGLGIAMGNASDAVKQAADLVVRTNAEGGALEAIDRALLLL